MEELDAIPDRDRAGEAPAGDVVVCATDGLTVVRRSAVGATLAELAIVGTLGVETVGCTAAMLDWLDSTPAPVVRFDLSEVDFLDARGVALLLGIGTVLERSDRSFQLVRGSGTVRRVLELCGLSGLLTEDG